MLSSGFCHLSEPLSKKKKKKKKKKEKENEKADKYLDLARELKRLWNKVMVILIVVGTLGTVTKDLERRLEELEIRGRMKTIQLMVFYRRLSDSKSPKFSRTLLSIMADLNAIFGWSRLVLGFLSLPASLSYLPTSPLGQDMTQGQF